MVITIISGLYFLCIDILNKLSFRDLTEIFILFFFFYYFFLWLSHDEEKPLIAYAYIYGIIIIASYSLSLYVVHYLAILFMPIIVVIFLLFHQKTLQKNFVSFFQHKKTPKGERNKEWKEYVLRALLSASKQKKSCFFIIENNNNLGDFVDIPYFFQAETTNSSLHFLIESVTDYNYIFLIRGGFIASIESRWKEFPLENENNEEKNLSCDESRALLASSHTDCLIMYTMASKEGINIVADGILTQNLTSQKALAYLKRHYLKENCGEN